MDPTEYRTRYGSEAAAAPGWDAIDQALASLHGKTQPWHWAPVVRGDLGGPDPLDGISAYKAASCTKSHFHFCSYGFSSLYYDEESLGNDFSGFGFELTFRLVDRGETQAQLSWVCNMLQNLGRYVFKSGRGFEHGHWIPANGPIKLGAETEIVGLAIVQDPQLPAIATVHGEVQFLQLVGLTGSELTNLKSGRTSVDEIISGLMGDEAFLVTDLDRTST